MIATSGFAFAWLALAKTEEIVLAPGKLEPIGQVKPIQMPLGGVAAQIMVKEGERVKQGQIVMRLDTEATADRQRTMIKTIGIKSKELDLKQSELERYLDLSRTEQRVLSKNLELQREILSRFNRLAKEGASAELQLLQQQDKVQQVEGQLEQRRDERLRQVALIEQQRQQLQGELADLRSKLTEMEVTLRYQTLRSPVDGLVFNLRPTAPGFVAQSSEPVMTIVPFRQLQARVEIPSQKIGFVRVGQPVDVSIDSFPASDFGVLRGTVAQIGSDALPPDLQTQKTELRFPAQISLESQELKLSNGEQMPLQVGMSLTANIKLRKVTYLQLLLGGFQEKAEALRRI
ncbi:HlyD family secretion protein [Synechococcus sp. CBW1107]|uniref:HlyD family secretion protein n=1 Tax=Synechococcus sp. CBW1107 TaxID=2789857 RepID=UPI002AD225ED|nr:HlyD family efflux transporter periplasmic adaptor subunit [Synechococcus sp. CBW1107]